jgi:glucuronate isomerase
MATLRALPNIKIGLLGGSRQRQGIGVTLPRHGDGGIYTLPGFNDDTRAFPSIPARHDVWRRAGANWVAGLRVRGLVDDEDAVDRVHELAYGLAKKAYKL